MNTSRFTSRVYRELGIMYAVRAPEEEDEHMRTLAMPPTKSRSLFAIAAEHDHAIRMVRELPAGEWVRLGRIEALGILGKRIGPLLACCISKKILDARFSIAAFEQHIGPFDMNYVQCIRGIEFDAGAPQLFEYKRGTPDSA